MMTRSKAWGRAIYPRSHTIERRVSPRGPSSCKVRNALQFRVPAEAHAKALSLILQAYGEVDRTPTVPPAPKSPKRLDGSRLRRNAERRETIRQVSEKGTRVV